MLKINLSPMCYGVVPGRKAKEIFKNRFLKGNLKIPFPEDFGTGVYFLNLKINKKNLIKKIVYIK